MRNPRRRSSSRRYSEKQFWCDVFCAALARSGRIADSADCADKALEEFDARFVPPDDEPEAYPDALSANIENPIV